MVSKFPDNYPRVTPALCVHDAKAAIEFYTSVLGATERERYEYDGVIGHAELMVGDSVIMLSDEFPEMNVVSPKTLGGTGVAIMVYVEDVDAVFAAALKAGATELRPVEKQFYGDRSGQFLDPWGHRWAVSTHVEDVDHDELHRRADEAWEAEAHA